MLKDVIAKAIETKLKGVLAPELAKSATAEIVGTLFGEDAPAETTKKKRGGGRPKGSKSKKSAAKSAPEPDPTPTIVEPPEPEDEGGELFEDDEDGF